MNITAHKTNVKAIRQGERNFTINDGMIAYPRAMLHILPECPTHVREMINWASTQGYLKTVAHVHDSELMWEALSK